MTALRPHLDVAQAAWLLDEIRLDQPPMASAAAPPPAPMTLATCLALLERCDPRPVRAPFHRLLIANLAASPLLEEARAALPTLPLDVVLRLSFHLESHHPLRRELSAEADRRCAEVAGSAEAKRVTWFADLLRPTIDRPDALQGMTVVTEAPADGELLARDYLERGRRMVGADLIAKADELRRLSHGTASVTGNLAHATLRRELAEKLEGLVAAKVASSPLTRDVALAAAFQLPVHAADAHGRARLFEQLVTALQLTHGEIARVVVELCDREPDARPELRKRLERAGGLPVEPLFPLQKRDRFSATTYSNPIAPDETSHELGHAYEAARPEVLSAAVAVRSMLAIGPARSLNDLAVIHAVARASGIDGMHAKLLRQLAGIASWPTLDSAKAVRALLAGNGLESAIDAVLAGDDWVRLRPYDASEMALPVPAHPYLGKICPDGSTEIVSVGFEKLTSGEQLLEAYLECPEHVLFTLGCLPG